MLRQAASDLLPYFCVSPDSLALRKQILATKGLDLSDFLTAEEGYKAADAMVAEYAKLHPDKVIKYPAQLYPGMPVLDAFWFGVYKGPWVSLVKDFFVLECVLDKDIVV